MENSKRKEKDLMLKKRSKRMENSNRKEKDLMLTEKEQENGELKEKRGRSNVDRNGVREWRTQRERRKV